MAAFCDDQATKKAVAPKATPIVPKAGGTVGTAPKSNPNRMVNPANPAVMLFKASPEERERALERGTPEQQKNARELLHWFDNLSPADKAIQLQRFDRYAQLSLEDRNLVKNMVASLNRLPREEQGRVRVALLNLQKLPEEQRHRRMQNENFASRFTPEQLDIIRALADVWFQ
jgi:hypothetical protein